MSHTKIIESCVFILLPIIIIPISRKKTSSPTSKHLLRASLANDQRKIIQINTRQLLKDPTTSIDTILKSIETMDTQRGMLYFSSFYVLAKILAIPAVPLLTASSGYLFRTLPGTATSLISAAVAASISYVIGRTLLRGYVEGVLEENLTFKSMDRAIKRKGFKLMLLLRLSPLFPFALSNYLYGASSIIFIPYFFSTLFGFGKSPFVLASPLPPPPRHVPLGGDAARPMRMRH